MKQYRKLTALLLIAVLLIGLTSCGKKKAEETLATETTGATSVETEASTAETGAKSIAEDTTEAVPETASALAEPEPVKVDAETGLVADTGDNARVFAQEGASISRIPEEKELILEEGSALLDITEEDAAPVRTEECTVEPKPGVFRVDVIKQEKTEVTQVEVFDGEAVVTISETGESVVIKAGESVLVAKPEGEAPYFVKADKVERTEDGLKIADDAKAEKPEEEAIAPIAYEQLPKEVAEKLSEIASSGRTLSIPEQKLLALLEEAHDYQESIDKEATCTEDGVLKLICSGCGDVQEKPIPATGHTEETIATYAPTCEETGLTNGTRCSVCGEVLKAQETIPALGHDTEVKPGKEATCTEPGLTDGKLCKVCGKWVEEQKTVPARGHTEVAVEAVAATCTSEGKTEGIVCSECGAVLSGLKTVEMTKHRPGRISEIPATCEEGGWTEGVVCRDCNYVMVPRERTPILGHTVEVIPGYAFSCTTDGLTDGEVCTVCGKTLKEQVVIPAHHVCSSPAIEKLPPCSEQHDHSNCDCFRELYICDVCGAFYYQATYKHAPGEPERIELSDGAVKLVYRCDVCKMIVKEEIQ